MFSPAFKLVVEANMWKTHSSTTRAWEPGRRFVTQFDEPKKKSRTMKGSRSLLLVVYIYMLIYLYSLFDSILIEWSLLGRNIWIQANSTTKKNDAQMAFLEDQYTFHVPAIDAGYNFKKYITSEMGACYRSNTKTKSLLKWWEKKGNLFNSTLLLRNQCILQRHNAV